MNKRIILFIAIAVMLSMVCLSACSSQSTTKTSSAPMTITAQELYSAYDANQIAADIKYKDKILTVTGVIESIGKDILNTPYIVLVGNDESIWGVQCMFGSKYELALTYLKEGQIIIVQGRCSSYLINVIMRDCILVY